MFYLANSKTRPPCPFGATCYRKNLLHFAEFSHPFNLLDPDNDSDDENEETKKSSTTTHTTDSGKKRKADSLETDEEDDDEEATEQYDSDDVS